MNGNPIFIESESSLANFIVQLVDLIIDLALKSS